MLILALSWLYLPWLYLLWVTWRRLYSVALLIKLLYSPWLYLLGGRARGGAPGRQPVQVRPMP